MLTVRYSREYLVGDFCQLSTLTNNTGCQWSLAVCPDNLWTGASQSGLSGCQSRREVSRYGSPRNQSMSMSASDQFAGVKQTDIRINYHYSNIFLSMSYSENSSRRGNKNKYLPKAQKKSRCYPSAAPLDLAVRSVPRAENFKQNLYHSCVRTLISDFDDARVHPGGDMKINRRCYPDELAQRQINVLVSFLYFQILFLQILPFRCCPNRRTEACVTG